MHEFTYLLGLITAAKMFWYDFIAKGTWTDAFEINLNIDFISCFHSDSLIDNFVDSQNEHRTFSTKYSLNWTQLNSTERNGTEWSSFQSKQCFDGFNISNACKVFYKSNSVSWITVDRNVASFSALKLCT